MGKKNDRPFGVVDGDLSPELDADAKQALIVKHLLLGAMANVEGRKEEGAALYEKAFEMRREFGPHPDPERFTIVRDKTD